MRFKVNIISKIKEKKTDLLAVFLLTLTLPLFFYKLGQSSLVSWDEAWYASISHNILKTGDWLNLNWNGGYYFDHPPTGFWMMAVSFLFFGVSEFTARLPSAITGFLSLVIVYLLAKELFNRIVGFLSAISTSTAIWFLYRARSGNLDIILTFFFLLSLYLAIKAAKNSKYLMPFSISLAFLFLSKTMVPLTIIPSLFIIFWNSKTIKIKRLFFPLIIFFVIAGSWFITQRIIHPHYFDHYFKIGLPGIKTSPNYIENIKLAKEYLHNGIGKWFWPGILGVIGGGFLFQRRFYILSSFFIIFFMPFIFSGQGQIWHLIPLQPIMIVAFFGFSYTLLNLTIKKHLIAVFILSVFSFYLIYIQNRQIWYQFIDIPAYVSDEAILSKEAKNYREKLYIDGDFVPSAAFYSEKIVKRIHYEGLVPLFVNEKAFLLITPEWRLDDAKIPKNQYQVIKKDRDKLLIKKV